MKIVRSQQGWQVAKNNASSGICLNTLAFLSGYRIAQICTELRCSEHHLLDIFKRDVGLKAKDWMRRERVVVARRMLAGGKRPHEVAISVGFNGTQNFSRDFIEFHQISPVKFQEKIFGKLN